MSSIGSIQIGDKASVKRRFSEQEVKYFAEMSGDASLIHLEETYAEKTIFKERIVHGLLVGSLFGGIFGSTLPGQGTVYLGQNFTFRKPVYIGEEVTAEVEITRIREDKKIVFFRTTIYKENLEIATEGDAVVMLLESGT